jgi:hypothetical protein
MASSMLEAMEMYQAPGAGTKVTKLDVKEVLGRTEQALFEKLSATRKAHLEKVLDGRPDPLGNTTAADNIAFSLRGKVVVITGASRGIGEAIAVRFAGRGASVVILAQSTTENPSLPGTVQQAVRACVAAGGDAIAIKTDIADEGQVQAAIKDAMKNYGGVIDILVNCASVHFPQRCADMDVKRYDALANVNVKVRIRACPNPGHDLMRCMECSQTVLSTTRPFPSHSSTVLPIAYKTSALFAHTVHQYSRLTLFLYTHRARLSCPRRACPTCCSARTRTS